MKNGRHCALKITKRRLTQKPVAQTTQIGAPTAISGSAASCALPANTLKVISSASGMDNPDWTIATPVTRAHADMPSEMAAMSLMPARKSGWRQVALRVFIGRDCDRLPVFSPGAGLGAVAAPQRSRPADQDSFGSRALLPLLAGRFSAAGRPSADVSVALALGSPRDSDLDSPFGSPFSTLALASWVGSCGATGSILFSRM